MADYNRVLIPLNSGHSVSPPRAGDAHSLGRLNPFEFRAFSFSFGLTHYNRATRLNPFEFRAFSFSPSLHVNKLPAGLNPFEFRAFSFSKNGKVSTASEKS